MSHPCNPSLDSLPDVFVDSGSSCNRQNSKAPSNDTPADGSLESRGPGSDVDSSLPTFEDIVTAPPNTPMNLESQSKTSISDVDDSYNTLNSRTVKFSRLSAELYATLAPSYSHPPTSNHVQVGLVRLHNLGVEEYDRVETWRYYVNHEMITNPSLMEPKLNIPNDEAYPSPVNSYSVFDDFSDSTSWGNERKMGDRSSTPFEVAEGASSEEENRPWGMYSGNGHEIEPHWEAPKPKFLQRLFQSVAQQ